MYKNINAANVLGTSSVALRKKFKDRQISDASLRGLQKGLFDPYFPSEDIIKRFKEISRDLGEPDAYRAARSDLRGLRTDLKGLELEGRFAEGGRVNYAEGTDPFMETGIKNLIGLLRSLRDDMKNMPLDGEFDVDTEGYIEPEQTAQQAPLPETPEVNAAALLQPSAIANTTLTQTGLTPTEQALLSQEEQGIRLRQRGMKS